MSLSLSLSGGRYPHDTIAIASLSAIEKGVTIVCAAGNSYSPKTIYNRAPWILTVGAGTLDRRFGATVTFGNGLTFEAPSKYAKSVYISNTALYYGGDNFSKSICNFNTLNATEVAGKVVVCGNSSQIDIGMQQMELDRVGAYAGILMADDTLPGDDIEIPILVLPTSAGTLVKEYASNVSNANVTSMRFLLTHFGKRPAPQVAVFSSRGPDPIYPSLPKPDVIAPGVEILAAIPPVAELFEFSSCNYTLVTDYALGSGTSMAAPHAAGIAALLKAAHPEWSPDDHSI